MPPSVKVGGSGRQLASNSVFPRPARKPFLAPPAALSPPSAWNLTDFVVSSVDGVFSPLHALSASRNELCDSPSSNLPSSRLPPGYVAFWPWDGGAPPTAVPAPYPAAGWLLVLRADLTGGLLELT